MLFPESLADFKFAHSKFVSFGNEGWQDANYHVAWVNLSNPEGEVYHDLGYKQDIELGYESLKNLLESSWGIDVLSDFLTLEVAKNLSEDQIDELINTLEEVSEDPSLITQTASMYALWRLYDIYSQGVFSPEDTLRGASYLEKLVEKYDNLEAAVQLGWLKYTKPAMQNRTEAEELIQKALQSQQPHIVVLAHWI